jgi:hypothetical protein
MLAAERIIVGWRDTRGARRALPDALPFLQRADAVTIVEISDVESQVDGRRQVDDVVRYLARRNVPAVSMIAACPGNSVADELIRLADAERRRRLRAQPPRRIGVRPRRGTCSHRARCAA